MNKILSIMLLISLQGCALFSGWDKEGSISIFKKEHSRIPLDLSDPPPLKPSVPKWIVVTPENQAQVFEDLKQRRIDQVLFALTDDDYEELSIDAAQIRNHISQQREILNRYREYYEPKTPAKK